MRCNVPTTIALSAFLTIIGGVSVEAQGFTPGEPLDLWSNTRVYGGFNFAESCSYDPIRDLYVVPSAGDRSEGAPDAGYVSLVNPDGSAHTLQWIGASREGLTLSNPLGGDIVNDVLYLADGNVIRSFDMRSGRPLRNALVSDMTRFNDVAVAPDATIYASHTRDPERVYRIRPDGSSSVFVDGAPLSQPNGVAFDPDGNIVVVNIGSDDVLTFSTSGRLLRTEHTVDPGNDGLVILPDGTKYVSSVRNGSVSRIRPGMDAELVASGIPSAASMCYDPRRSRLMIPMNPWNALAFIELN